jgi:hypothetical protein
MDSTAVAVALIAVLGTLLSPVAAKWMELRKSQFEDAKEERGLIRAWLRKHNEDRYNRVKNWVIDVMKAIDPSPIKAWEPDIIAPKSLQQSEDLRQHLNRSAAEVKVFASCDEQLAQDLQTFIDILNNVGDSEDSTYIKTAHSVAAKIIDRVYVLMLQVPKENG